MTNPFLRASEDGLETAVAVYSSGKGKSILFAPSIHIALSEYYAELNKRLNSQDIVIYESFLHDVDPDPSKVPDFNDISKSQMMDYINIRNYMNYSNFHALFLARKFGLSLQIGSVFPRKEKPVWVAGDLDSSEIFLEPKLDKGDFVKHANSVINAAFASISTFDYDSVLSDYNHFLETLNEQLGDNQMLDALREEKIDKIIMDNIEQDVGIIYGLGHAISIEQKIISKGYYKSSEEFLLAVPYKCPVESFLK